MEVHNLELQTAVGPASIARAVLTGLNLTAGLGRLRLQELRLEDASVALSKLALLGRHATTEPWRCEPVGGTDGMARAYITDAAWVIDADVTIPIERGRIDFNDVRVQHVGPDSSMGLSRMGLHVDAPTGRTYLYLWSATHVPGARFEQRGTLLTPVADRGSLELQPFVEALLAGVLLGAPAAGAREMLRRTRLSGQFRLGDGRVGNERQHLTLAGRREGRNRVELSSMPTGQGFGLRVAELSAVDLHLEHQGRLASAAALSATLGLHLKDPAGEPSIEAKFSELTLSGIDLQL